MSIKLTARAVFTSLAAQLLLHGAVASGTNPWEWSGIFDLHSDHPYTLVISTPGENVSLVVVATDEADAHGLEEAEAVARPIWTRDENNATLVTFGGTVNVNGYLHKLDIDTNYYTSLYKLIIPTDGKYAIFLEHFPSEFEARSGAHWIKNDEGTDVETVYPSSATTDNGNVVGVVFLATFIVSLTGMLGLLLLMPLKGYVEASGSCRELLISLTSTFASGALVAVAMFLIIPEAHIYWQVAHPTDEPLQNFSTGASVLAGIIACYIIHMICSINGLNEHSHGVDIKSKTESNTDVELATTDKANGKAQDPADAKSTALIRTTCTMTPSQWNGIAWNVLIGDTLHNIADGVAIAVAFKSCDNTFGWTLTGGVIAHEVVQELSDFCVLVVRGNVSVCSATILNFLSNCSCIIAGVAAANAEMGREAKAFILCFSAGTYLWIGLAECIPGTVTVKSISQLLLRFSAFMIAVIIIGLILIGHKHCEVSSSGSAAAADPHAGHGH